MRILFLIVMAFPFLAEASEMDSFYDQMKYLSQRDRIISENIANADTPNYQPKELKKRSDKVNDFDIAKTNAAHMDIDGSAVDFELTKSDIREIKPNGNAVSLEDEMLKKSENSLKLMEVTNLYNKSRGMFKAAVAGSK